MLVWIKKNNKKLLLVLFLSLLYSCFWFYTAHKLEKYTQQIVDDFYNKKEGLILAKQQVKITGFPFYFKLRLTNLDFIGGSSQFIDFHFSANVFKAQTNVLLSHFKFFVPELFSLRLKYNNSNYYYNFVNSASHTLEFKSREFYNLDKFFFDKNFQLQDVAFQNFKMVHYVADKIQMVKNQGDRGSIASMNLYLQNNLQNAQEYIFILDNNFALQSDYGLFSSIKNNFLVKGAVKFRDEGYADIKDIDVKNFILSLDKTKFVISGDIPLRAGDEKNIEVKIDNLDLMIDYLISKNYITEEQNKILHSLVKEITGNILAKEINFVIQKNGSGLLRFGLVDHNTIKNVIEQFKENK